MNAEAQRLIAALGLEPHPEGGYFKQTYRSSTTVQGSQGLRRAATSIYYLLEGDDFSSFHRLQSDEIWHHYRGAAVAIEIIEPTGKHVQLMIGEDDRLQAAILAGSWFAAHLCGEGAYALVGCDVAPGFEYEDFEIGTQEALVTTFPHHRSLIERWTRARQ